MEEKFKARQVWDVPSARALVRAAQMEKGQLKELGLRFVLLSALALATAYGMGRLRVGLLCIALMAAATVYRLLTLEPLAAKRLWAQWQTRCLEMELSFGAEALEARDEYWRCRYGYDSFSRFALCRGRYLLFYRKNRALIFAPESVSGGDARALEAFVREKTGLDVETVRCGGNMDTKFAFRVRYDKAAFRAMYRTSQPHARYFKKARAYYLVVALLCAAALIWMCYAQVRRGLQTSGDRTYIVFVIFLVYAIRGWRNTGSPAAVNALAEKSLKAYGAEEEYDAVFTDEEMRSLRKTSEEAMRYEALTRFVDCEGHYLLYVAPAKMHVLPKDGLVEGELPDFERFLQQKTGLALERYDP